MKWIRSDFENKLNLFIFFIISIGLSLFIIRKIDVNFLINTILVASAYFLFFITLRDFFTSKFKNLSQNLAHFGFSLLILSILFNNFFSTEIITNLKLNESFENDSLKINFESIEQKDQQNFKTFIGKFLVEDSKGIKDIMQPELRIYNQPNIITSEADIKTTLYKDKFMTMNSVQNQEYFNIRYQVKPFMVWIWLSTLLIVLSGFVSFFRKKHEN